MKKHKGLLLLLMISVLALLMVLTAFDKKETNRAGIYDRIVDITGGMLARAVILEPEAISEIRQTYIERYGLEKLDKPKKRNKEQTLERLAELSAEYELVKQIYEDADSYSEQMLANIANNPEVAAFALNSEELYGQVLGGFSEEELEAEFPLLIQFDPRWGYYEYGGKELALTGCGPTCLAMVLLSLTDCENMTPDKVADYSIDNEYYIEDVGTAWKLIDTFPAEYGLEVTHPLMNEASMKAELDKGKMLICSVRKGVFTPEGHFVVFYGYDENGFKVNDPNCIARSRQTWEYKDFGRQIKKIWAIGNEKT